jgi:hypothetical protein
VLVTSLINQASRPTTPAAPAAVIGDMQGIHNLFNQARAHLRRPAIVLSVPDLPHPIRLSVAGSTARVPGSIHVVQADYTGSDFRHQRTWYGRIMQDGTFRPGREIGEHAPRITARLQALAANPATVAAEHGRLTGRCCFCNRHLTDERSTAVGYGPTCASHFGLAWGSREAAPSLPAPAFVARSWPPLQMNEQTTSPDTSDYYWGPANMKTSELLKRLDAWSKRIRDEFNLTQDDRAAELEAEISETRDRIADEGMTKWNSIVAVAA